MTKRFTIKHNYGTVIVREFKYEEDDGSFAATIWIGNTNSEQETDAMLSRAQTVALIEALQDAIEQPIDTDPAVALQRVIALADKWDNARHLGDGAPSIVARAFAEELHNAIQGR